MTFVGIEYLKSLNYHLNDFSPIKTCTNVRSYEDCIATFSKVILRKKITLCNPVKYHYIFHLESWNSPSIIPNEQGILMKYT